MRSLYLSWLIFLFLNQSFAQQNNSNYFQGYSKSVAGKNFGYHSPIPEVTTSLLLRGQNDYEPIVWETEVVPDSYRGKYVSFIWVFGRDVTADQVNFHLVVNNKKWFTFKSSKTSETGIESYQGENGAELHLNVTMLDKYEDQMGFAILKIPIDAISLNEPNQIKIETDTENNNAWFMTYKTSLEEKVNIYQNHVVIKKDGQLYNSVSLDIIHLGEDEKVSIKVNGELTKSILKAGYNRLDVNVPKVDVETPFTAEIKVGKNDEQIIPFTISPVREWEIFLVQHTHTDIGYTRPQTEILPEHLRYIDNALDFCDQTDDYPDVAKFRWTCETSWSVREFINSRPKALVDKLIKRIQEGRIEATGMFFNFSEIIDESALAAQTKTIRMLKNKGIDVTTAMQNDVNGIAWCMVDYYHNTDVKYLSMGIHAHRARKPFNQPTAFWWQSPSGNRLLAYRSEHYQHGNSLSLTIGAQDIFRNNLSNYLISLEERNYPYNKIALQFSGYVTDNSPPSTKVCDIIKDWNEKYEWPKLKSALARDFMVYLDEYHSDSIQTHEVAWPDWWTDGVASAANETKVARKTQTEMINNTALLSMGVMLGADLPENINEGIESVYDNLLFYDEHTHGAAESVSDPLAQNTVNQWAMKSAYVWEAAKGSSALQEKALAYIEPFLPASEKPSINIFNTLGWKRSGLVYLFLQYELVPEGVDFTIADEDGVAVDYQVDERRQEGAYYQLWVEDIPPFGFKTYSIHVGEIDKVNQLVSNENFENEYYRIQLENSEGVVASIFDKELQIELIDQDDSLSFGQFIYEELANRHSLERLTSTTRDTVYKQLDLTRKTLTNIELLRLENGPIFQSILLNGKMPICADERGVNIEIRLFHHQKRIEFHYQMFKLANTKPEGVYVAFPFQLEKGKLAFEAQGGVVYPGVNQLGGSAADWNTIQNYAAVKNDEAQIIISSPEIPLVQFGNLNIGRYYYRLKPLTNHIFSWVLNNYWVTNFKASQQGELRWSYAITSSNSNSTIAATEFGWGNSVPLLSRIVFPKKKTNAAKKSNSFLSLGVPNLLLVNARPSMDRKGIVLHLRELEGDHAILDIRRIMDETAAVSIQEVNILEEEIKNLTSPLLIEHYETRFIKLNFE